jgi:hypothetical protein
MCVVVWLLEMASRVSSVREDKDRCFEMSYILQKNGERS